MELFKFITPIIYWILIICWSFILVFYLRRIKSEIYKDKMIITLLVILSIDSFRTVIESSYFGAWYTSLAGLISIEVFNTLAQPELVFIPKILNLVAALLVIFILLRKWIPAENQRIEDLTDTVIKQKLTYDNLLNSMQDVVIIVDQDWNITDANQSVLTLQFGYQKEEILNKKFEVLQDIRQRSSKSSELETLVSKSGTTRKLLEMSFKKKNGDVFNSETFISKIDNDLSDSIGYFIVIRDITERKLVEESLQKLSSAVQQSPSSVVITDLYGAIEYVNPKFEQLTGYSLEKVLGKNSSILQSGEQSNGFYHELWNTISDGKEWQGIFHNKKKNGDLYWESAVIAPIKDNKGEIINYVSVKKDITEQRQAEDQLNASLKEKETLLHEVHHRVKNNMQVINSLLKLQSNNIEDVQTKEILKDSQSRVYAMSAVHETLHGSERLSEIDLKAYLSKITTSVFQTYSTDHRKVKLNSNVDNSPINLNQAYPLGLVINELMSNSLKYAFPDNREGEVSVSLKKLDKELELTIADDGIGIPDGLDWKNSKSLGLKLVRTLVEKQLDGSIDVERNNGTKFTIKFNIES
jgi:PAS domain S-box-containing protein